jgi:hypothetical protein
MSSIQVGIESSQTPGETRPRTSEMDDLLAEVLDAHGGLEEWGKVSTLTAKLSLGGPFWGLRGWPKVYAGQTVTLDAHREHITFAPFTAPDRV